MAWGIAAAVVGGSLISGIMGSNAADSAADAQKQAAERASQTQMDMFNQQRADLAPWRKAGEDVLPQISQGIQPGGEFNRQFTMNDFNQDPGYQFRIQEAQKALEKSSTARGNLQTGGFQKSLGAYMQDMASNEYQNAYNRFQTDRGNRFGRLATVAGFAQPANQIGAQLSQNTANQIGSNQLQAGNATSAGIIGGQNAMNSGISNAMNQYMQYQYMPKPSPISNFPGGGMQTPSYSSGGGIQAPTSSINPQFSSLEI